MATKKKPHRRARVDVIRQEDRRAQVARLYLTRLPLRAIGKQLGVTATTIHRDLEAIRLLWREQSSEFFTTRIEEELARLDQLEAEAWDAWRESRKARKTTTEDASFAAQKKNSAKRKSVRTESPNPDAALLRVVFDCVDTRLQIMGIYKKNAFEFFSFNNVPALPFDLSKLTNEQLNDIERIMSGESPSGREPAPAIADTGATPDGASPAVPG